MGSSRWLLKLHLHLGISTALMRPRRSKQYCLQLVIYVCMYLSICMYVCTVYCICALMRPGRPKQYCLRKYMYIYIYVCVCVCVCVCMYIYMCVCVYLTNRFHVAVRLFSNRSQMTSKCGRTKKWHTRRSRVCH